MKQCKWKRVWDREFETFIFPAHLWEWVLLWCGVWRWEACARISRVVVVHWNIEWKRGEVPVGATAGCVYPGAVALALSVCIHPFAKSRATKEGQWPDRGLWLATDIWCLSVINRCCGDTLHDKSTKHRLPPNVKPCKILALETSVKKVMFPLIRKLLLKISRFLSSRYSLFCAATFPYIDISPGFSGFVHNADKRPGEEIPHALLSFVTLLPRISEGLRLFSQGKLLI